MAIKRMLQLLLLPAALLALVHAAISPGAGAAFTLSFPPPATGNAGPAGET